MKKELWASDEFIREIKNNWIVGTSKEKTVNFQNPIVIIIKEDEELNRQESEG
jgi:hypothetical protein